MEEFVHNYLSTYYNIETSKVGNDGIYLIEQEDGIVYPIPVYGDRLIKELILIFFEDEVTLKRYINKWAKTKYSDVNLKFFWQQKEPWFPQVIPLSTPTGILSYFDYVYSGNTPNINGRTYGQEVMNMSIDRVNAHAAVLLDRINESNQPVFLSSRASFTEDDNTLNIDIKFIPNCGVNFIEHKININKNGEINLDSLE